MISEVILQKLNLEFEKRKISNQRYSLRAYARDLNIPASILCRIRSRSLAISDDRKAKLKTKLFKDDEEFHSFCTEHLSSSNFISSGKKLSQKDFYFFRLWCLWTQLHLNKQYDLEELKSIAIQNQVDFDDLNFLFNYVKNNLDKSSDDKKNDFIPIFLFKNISQDAFEERFINFLYKLPESFANEVKPFMVQKTFPLAINAEIAEQIQEKIKAFSIEIVNLIEQNPSPKDHVCEFIVSLLPSTNSHLQPKKTPA